MQTGCCAKGLVGVARALSDENIGKPTLVNRTQAGDFAFSRRLVYTAGLICGHPVLGRRRVQACEILPASQAMKDEIHPKYYPEAKVFFRGEQVMTVGATVPEMHVEVWSGSHPFFTGQ